MTAEFEQEFKGPDNEVAPVRHYRAVAEALFVTVLWASSWVIIKFGLQREGIPPITFAGLRYVIAALILLVIILSDSVHREFVKKQDRQWWKTIFLYGVVFVAVTQGAQFIGLDLLDAIPVSMLLNLTPIVVLGLGIIMLKETPTRTQTILVFLVVMGAMIYFYPIDLDLSETVGLVVVLFGVLANAFSSIMGRSINRNRATPPIVVTGVSMVIGAIILLVTGFILEGTTVITPIAMVYILWLSIVNTAFAFTIWNKAMQTLRAVDITVINSTMLPQIVILSIVFLDEMPDLLDWIGLVILAACVALIQILQARRLANGNQKT
ncbi:MAG: DMT family transporter [Candidatus Thorarchaeota archaeon]